MLQLICFRSVLLLHELLYCTAEHIIVLCCRQAIGCFYLLYFVGAHSFFPAQTVVFCCNPEIRYAGATQIVESCFFFLLLCTSDLYLFCNSIFGFCRIWGSSSDCQMCFVAAFMSNVVQLRLLHLLKHTVVLFQFKPDFCPFLNNFIAAEVILFCWSLTTTFICCRIVLYLFTFT